ncbi:MAG: peroxidase-related enzyme [Gemmobacter sp.]
MHIGILQTGAAPDALRPDHGDYPDAFERLLAAEGFRFTTWRVEEMEFPPGIDAADGWLITGSRHGAYEDHPFIRPLEAFIRAALGAGVPVVGICFGHQIMAQAMGGRVERFAGGWAVGPTRYDFGGETLTLNAWHRDQVVAVPPGAEVIAQNWRAAPLPARQRAILGFAVKLTRTPAEMGEADRAALRDAGLDERAIWDVAAVAAFFNMSNRLASAVEMQPNPDYHHAARSPRA